MGRFHTKLQALCGQVVRDGVLDHTQQLFGSIDWTNRQLVEQLNYIWKYKAGRARLAYGFHRPKKSGSPLSFVSWTCNKESLTHQSRETLERSWDTDVRVDLNQDVPGSVNVNLQQTSLVQRTVQEGQQALLDKQKKEWIENKCQPMLCLHSCMLQLLSVLRPICRKSGLGNWARLRLYLQVPVLPRVPVLVPRLVNSNGMIPSLA